MKKAKHTKPRHVAALESAIKIAGSQGELADRIADFMGRPTISQQTVSKWLNQETLIAAEYWPALEHATEGKVTRVSLRPDVFGSSSRAA